MAKAQNTIVYNAVELPVISASKLKVFKTCAKQYYYKYKLPYNSRPEDHKNVAALMGTALHRAIELKYTEGKSPTFTFQSVMTDTIEEWENNKLQINAADYFPRAMKVGKDILLKFEWDKFNPQDLEYNFTLPFPNKEAPIVMINGLIDMIDMSGMIVDHKSASYAPAQDELDHDPQFLIYYWAYEQIYGAKPWKVVWNHLRTAKLIEANIEHNYADKLKQLQSDIEAMLHTTHYARRQMDSICKTKCSFYPNCYGEKPQVAITASEDE